MEIPEPIRKACVLLRESGFEAYAVGGCVRDRLMGKTPNDWDMTTSAAPEQMKEVFSGFRLIETGIKHGTVTVIIDGESVEITSFRTETGYSDNRHPDAVLFTDELSEDLSRRDFTVNAMAMDPLTGEITDLYGGKADLADGLIRCVGQPDRRFGEDALRILRALRFSSTLGFSIEEKTAESIVRNRELLLHLSVERIYAELKKLIVGKNVYEVLTRFPSVFAVILPEIEQEIGYDQKNFHHIHELWTHTAVAVANAPEDVEIRLCMLLHDCGKPHCRSFDESGTAHYYGHAEISASLAEEAFRRLKSDKKTAEAVITLIRHHDAPLPDSEKLIKRRLRQFGEGTLRKLLAVHRADTLALAPEFIEDRLAAFHGIEALLDTVTADQPCFSLKKLAINGNDVAALGYRGKEIGAALERCLSAVTDGEVKNERDALLALLRR